MVPGKPLEKGYTTYPPLDGMHGGEPVADSIMAK